MSRRAYMPRWHMRQWRRGGAEEASIDHAALAHARAIAALRDDRADQEFPADQDTGPADQNTTQPTN